MKKTVKLISVLSLAALAICSCKGLNPTPAFDQKDACVGIGASTYSFDEDAGQVAIPVSIATINGVDTKVSYALSKDTTMTAKEGVNFEFVDPTKTLKFSKDNRTDSIRIKIINIKGEYTGNVKLGLVLTASPDVPVSADSTTTVTIKDLDHPLSDLIGSWTSKCVSYWDGPVTGTTTMAGEDDDLTKIWIAMPQPAIPMKIYGIVSGEPGKRVITVTAGQQFYNTYDFLLLAFDGSGGSEKAKIEIKQREDGTLVAEEYGFAAYAYDHTSGEALGYYDAFLPGGTWEKQ